MTLVLIAASLIAFLWILSLLVGSVSQVVREAGQAAVLQYDERDLLDLIAEKRAALLVLKESELDFETGKVGESEYEEVHAAAVAEAIAVMRRLDEVKAGFKHQAAVDRDLEAFSERAEAPPTSAGSTSLLVADDEWEEAPGISAAAQIRARRKQEAAPVEAAPEPPTDAFATSEASAKPETKGSFCIACGTALVAGAKFCGECGHKAGAPVGDA